MTDRQKETLYNRTLAFVNRARAGAGLKPLKRLPKGVQSDTCECPLAMALGVRATEEELYVKLEDSPRKRVRLAKFARALRRRLVSSRGCTQIPVPKYIERFVYAFDNGEYPELVKKS